MYNLSCLAELFSIYFSETIMKIRNELYYQTFLRSLPKLILSLMLPYPPSTVSIKQFSFTDCSTIWVSLVMSLIDFLHIFLVEFKLALFTRLHVFQHRYLPVFHKDRRWVIFFSFNTLSLCLSLSTVIDHH